MKETLMAVLTLLLGGGIGAAIVTGINERWKFKAQREAIKEDREAEKEDRTDELDKEIEIFQKEETERMEGLEAQIRAQSDVLKAQSEALRLVLLDRVLFLGQRYIDQKEISYDDRRRFHEMHDCYHKGLGGNGDADLIVAAVDELPLKQ